ncbi:hypothetical protein HME7025_00749 [Aquirufa nivalisilvae]|uniref:DUF5777 domain-containing protein n=1 Tax=Aquirufa nivalisilvae TaxID=2516557 RepID=A0A2S2DUA7_9BACT|nr:DUF5777 family beta-barrel protein [Aquirufa nivalisilvae]AWL08620.1 hypothetical protein HME7025_00749 [Aquirufa nivalisilvae]
MKKISFLLLFLSGMGYTTMAQDDLMEMLDKESSKDKVYTQATFKGSRLINGQTIETVAKKHLNFWISHRFGAVNSGFLENFFGLDEARIRLGLEYGITDQWLLGAGRSSIEKTYDFYTKYKILRQSNQMPVSVAAYGSLTINSMPTGYTMPSGTLMRFYNNQQRQSYVGQVLIARKMNEKLSLQVMPTILHNNLSESTFHANDIASIGFGGRFKLSNRLSLSAEYYKNLVDKNAYLAKSGEVYPYHDSFALGFDIETGGHVFQLHFSNSRGMIEKHFIGQTTGTWDNGDIFYGFNIARTFSFDPEAKKTHK